ncbi:MAG: hypothetical protein ABIQ84_09135 [Usitatibacter sp.]
MKALASLAAAALLVAAGLAGAIPETRARDVVDTLVLLRWGHGALDWLQPDPPGGNNDERDRKRRG